MKTHDKILTVIIMTTLSLAGLLACGQQREHVSTRSDQPAADATQQAPTAADAKPGLELLRGEHAGFSTYCVIQLDNRLGNTQVPCRNFSVANVLLDTDAYANVASGRCVQRAYEYAAYCGVPRTTVAYFDEINLTTGAWFVAVSRVQAPALIAGAFDAAAGKWVYYVPN